MKKKRNLDRAIESCISHVKAQQHNNGHFNNLVGDKNMQNTEIRSTTFNTSIILSCLYPLRKHVLVEEILQKGEHFLLQERNANWSWNYWKKNEVAAKRNPYPDDLDDTFCALIVLTMYRKEILDGNALAMITELLIHNESQAGGPYTTWIIDAQEDPRWQDIDIAVNSNIAFFLDQHNVVLPNIVSLIENAIKTQNFYSKYYSPTAVIYFISRWYKGALKHDLEKFLLEKKDIHGMWGDILTTSMTVSALLLLGAHPNKVKQAVKNLNDYATEGLFQPFPFYIEESKKEILFCGSTALTASFCVESLMLYRMSTEQTKQHKQKQEDKISFATIKQVQYRLNIFSPKIQQHCSLITKRMLEHDTKRQISLLSFFTIQSLKSSYANSKTTSIRLGSANLFGWLAYKIYDDILDNEGNIELLPVANICLREASSTFSTLFKNYSYFSSRVFDQIEKANAWERQHCFFNTLNAIESKDIPSYGNYSIIAEKSLAHALGPLYIFITQGFNPSTKEFKHLYLFFKHYLIARQLNDDAHDWATDMQRGFLNSVSSRLLKSYFKMNMFEEVIVSDTSIESMQHLFWDSTIIEISTQIFSEVKKAEACLKKIEHVIETSYFKSLLLPIQRATEQALEEKQKAQSFIQSYSSVVA